MRYKTFLIVNIKKYIFLKKNHLLKMYITKLINYQRDLLKKLIVDNLIRIDKNKSSFYINRERF